MIGNAIKFTYTGEIAVNLEFNSVTRILSTYVRDTGLGIKAKDLSKLFKFFGQATNTRDINRGGMGLGLTISKMMVEQLGGTIDVESQTGVGSSFFFTLPLLEDAPINDGIVPGSLSKDEIPLIQI